MPKDFQLYNAQMVRENQVEKGRLVFAGSTIKALDPSAEPGPGAGAGMDCEGDYLLPGLVELHTDMLEKHIAPREGVDWPALPAVLAHDAQLAVSGITTAANALSIGSIWGETNRLGQLEALTDALAAARDEGLLKLDHRLHLRCEISEGSTGALFDALEGRPSVRPHVLLLSLMDHTPGQRQFRDLDRHRSMIKNWTGLDDAGCEAFIQDRRQAQARYAEANSRNFAKIARERGWTLASHDDTTSADVARAAGLGANLIEFPTTREAAAAARAHHLGVIIGAPNIIRGGSHYGNISGVDLAARGLADILSSDYVPSSLLLAVFHLAARIDSLGLTRTVAMATSRPADLLGLTDRGRLAPGCRADLLRVGVSRDGLPVVKAVWSAGIRVA